MTIDLLFLFNSNSALCFTSLINLFYLKYQIKFSLIDPGIFIDIILCLHCVTISRLTSVNIVKCPDFIMRYLGCDVDFSHAVIYHYLLPCFQVECTKYKYVSIHDHKMF